MDNNTVTKSFVDRVRRFASAHDLFVRGGRYIVALSGGADSVSMLLVMRRLAAEYGFVVDAAHCNFHLRGDESCRDERFCVELCRRLGIALHLVHFDTREYAALHHVSIEMAARDLRYAYFERLRHDINATDICVAHHRDDSVETVLLNLVRGTGIRGLRGIQPRNGRIIRPLLCLGRADILRFLNACGEGFVTDSTNLHNDVKRNKIRLDIIPMLEQLNPSVAESIFDTSLRMGEAMKMYDAAVEQSLSVVVQQSGGDDIAVDVDSLLRQPSPESVLFHILNDRGFSSSQVTQIMCAIGSADTTGGSKQLPSGKVVASATHELLFDRRRLIVQPIAYGVSTRVMRMPEPGTYVYSDSIKISVSEEPVGSGYRVSREQWCVCVDAAAARFPLTLRPLREGEHITPFGMKRSKLVSDLLTDCKATLFDKRRQLVVADSDDRIVWLVGRRISETCRIGASTTSALRISIVQ